MRKDAGDVVGCRKALGNVIDLLRGLPDEQPIGPVDQIPAGDLRTLASSQLELLALR